MNYVGKILVILNLVFAVVVIGFLVVGFAARMNWRDAYEKLDRETQVAARNWGTGSETLAKLDAAIKKAQQERDTARQEVADGQAMLNAQIATAKADLAAAELRVKDAELTMQKYLAEKERLAAESKAQLALIEQRDKTIVDQQTYITKYRSAAVSQESAYKAAESRLEQAVSRNAELERALQQMKSGGPTAVDAPIVRGRPNPPTVYVEGKIDSIYPSDSSLVQITVGSDKGLTKNQTLEVFRVDPPTYLGMIRIVDVTPHQAVGRLERIGTANRTPLRVGDTVASTVSRN